MPKKRIFLPYTKARLFARSLRLKNRTEWRAYAKQHRADLEATGVPCSPEVYYASPQAKHDRGYGYKAPTDPATAHLGAWIDWHDWLGSSYAPRISTKLAPLDEFVSFLQQHGITTQVQYQHWRKTNSDKPQYQRMPGAPSAVYANVFSWTMVAATPAVGTTLQPRRKGGAKPQRYAPFAEVRREVRTLAFTKREQWTTHVKDNPEWLRERQCPAHPERVAQYSAQWRGWADFLGSDTRAVQRYKRD